MMERQGRDLGDMGDTEREQGKPILVHLRWDQIFEGLCQTEPPEADLDPHLPETGCTDELGVLLILDQISSLLAKPGVAIDEP